MHYLFRKVFCNILIKKFQNYTPRTGCIALYMSLILNIYRCPKYCILLLLLPFHIISFLELGHPTWKNTYEYNTKTYLRRYILLNKIVCFFSSKVLSPVLIFYFFLLKCPDTDLCPPWLITYWNKNDESPLSESCPIYNLFRSNAMVKGNKPHIRYNFQDAVIVNRRMEKKSEKVKLAKPYIC